MDKRKISASEFISDIRNGCSNDDLMKKYQVSVADLNILIEKLISAGVFKREELSSRITIPRTNTCPGCGADRGVNLEECPKCGIIYSKVKRQKPPIPPENSSPIIREPQINPPATNQPGLNNHPTPKNSNLEECSVCGKMISKTAELCPNCGEKRATVKSTVPVIGIVAIGLGVGASFMPYFAAVFLVPAAIICGIIAVKKSQKALGSVAVALGIVGLIGILYTSNQIKKITSAIGGKSGEVSLPQSFGSASPVVTRSEFEKIRSGLSYAEVCSIIGESGNELSKSEFGQTTSVMYSWTNSNGSNMTAMFQNDRLINKAQFGLQ